MNVLLLGSGGREHALAWKIAQSPLLKTLYIAPGNAGTDQCGKNVNINISDFSAVESFIINNDIGMLVVGPEAPLVEGIHDYLISKPELKGLKIIGPQKAGAMLEGSKDFAKAFMHRHHIPTAAYRTFTYETINEAHSFLDTLNPPYVIKADGLAAGKGVIICDKKNEAINTIDEILKNEKFGEAGSKVVIEEFLDGIEMSVFVLTDGKKYILLPEAKDYKRIGEGDTGPNTGGMGSISPVPFADKDLMLRIEKEVVIPTIKGLKKDNIPYTGFIFFGLMICNDAPFVIEYNVRMGDPETESVIPRIESDLLEAFEACATGKLSEYNLQTDARFAATVMLVSEGYPGSYEKGKKMTISEKAFKGVLFHAGTKKSDDFVVSNGGRVLAVTAYGNTMDEALKEAYNHVPEVNFEGKTFRNDLGKDLQKYC
ncbi:MAG: phosphoribosylamine--glycine ligase [Marinilabiliales bacterium]|nr:MAG: phosphoribosylamine--glycine ligase [Marinilabiliales bacterium]